MQLLQQMQWEAAEAEAVAGRQAGEGLQPYQILRSQRLETRRRQFNPQHRETAEALEQDRSIPASNMTGALAKPSGPSQARMTGTFQVFTTRG